MIELTDCIRAISDAIEELFGEPPTTKDIVEGFDRPATYIYPSNIECERNGMLRHDTYDLFIVRFAEREYAGYLELLDYQKQLEELLTEPIEVEEGFLIYPENIRFGISVQDMGLQADFRLQNFQLCEETEEEAIKPVMEEFLMGEEKE